MCALEPLSISQSFFFFFFGLFVFLGPYLRHMEVSGWGVELELTPPEPQQLRIWATSVTYTTTHGKARSPSQWVRPGIEPKSSWMLVGFVHHWAMTAPPISQTLIMAPFPLNYSSIFSDLLHVETRHSGNRMSRSYQGEHHVIYREVFPFYLSLCSLCSKSL